MTNLIEANVIEDLTSNSEALQLVFEDDSGQNKVFNIESTDAHYSAIKDAVHGYVQGDVEDEYIFDLCSVEGNISRMSDNLADLPTNRFEFDFEAGVITYDGEVIDSQITNQIIRMAKSESASNKKHLNALIKFVENLYKNQSEFVRQQFFGWLTYTQTFESGFTITEDGCLLGYKGCAWGEVDGERVPVSINHGHAFADGVEYHGAIPNKIGSIVSMARSEVTDDPNIGCSAGLHVGTYSYASGWAKGVLLLVKVNPRDIVSVPTECDAQKIRCSRYEVLEVTEVEYTEPVYCFEDDDEDWDYCEDCDDYPSRCNCW